MARPVRFELNRRNIGELLRSAEVQADLDRRAQNIADAAGPGMETESDPSATRARAEVRTATYEARLAEARGRALTRAIEAGRS